MNPNRLGNPIFYKINTGPNMTTEIKNKLLRILRHLRTTTGTLRYAWCRKAECRKYFHRQV